MEGKYNPKTLAEETEQNLGNQPVRSTQSYEPPLFRKQEMMNFPEKIWEQQNKGKFPLHICSRCHHCR